MQSPVKKRGAIYPAVTLKQAVEMAQEIATVLGTGPYTRQIISRRLGYSEVSGLTAAKLSSCVHFGLMTNNGSGYRLTALGQRLVSPSAESQTADLFTAVSAPLLYAQLIDHFTGRELPRNLDEILINSYGIGETVAGKVARTFRASADYAGILNKGRLLLLGRQNHDKTPPSLPALDALLSPLQPNPSRSQAYTAPQTSLPAQGDSIRIALPGTSIAISFPDEYAYDLSIGTFREEITALQNKAITAKEKGGNM